MSLETSLNTELSIFINELKDEKLPQDITQQPYHISIFTKESNRNNFPFMIDGVVQIHLVNSRIEELAYSGFNFNGKPMSLTKVLNRELAGEHSYSSGIYNENGKLQFRAEGRQIFVAPGREYSYIKLVETALAEYLHSGIFEIVKKEINKYLNNKFKPENLTVEQADKILSEFKEIDEGIVHSAILLYLSRDIRNAESIKKSLSILTRRKEYILVEGYFDALNKISHLPVNLKLKIPILALYEGEIDFLLRGKDGIMAYTEKKFPDTN